MKSGRSRFLVVLGLLGVASGGASCERGREAHVLHASPGQSRGSPAFVSGGVVSPPSRSPLAIAVTPDGGKAYVAYDRGPVVTVIDVASHTVLHDVAVPVRRRSGLPIELAIDPEGRHVFLVDPAQRSIVTIDTSTDTASAPIPVPAGSRSIAFDFGATTKRIFVTNQRDEAILPFAEGPAGVFTAEPAIGLQGRGPGPIAVLASGRLVVGQRGSKELEIVDPALPSGAATVARLALGSVPLDVVISGSRVLVPTFTPTPSGTDDGRNELLEIDPATPEVLGAHLVNAGTDYDAAAVAPLLLALIGSGSGSLVIADPLGLGLLAGIDLAPGDPVARPIDLAFVPNLAGTPIEVLVLNHFRATVRPIDVTTGPPFALLPEIPLGSEGRPRIPLVDLTPAQNGEWFFTTVAMFNGTPSVPNNVTCATCHPGVGSDGNLHLGVLRQAPHLFRVDDTGPWGANGMGTALPDVVLQGFIAHGIVGGPLPAGSDELVIEFLSGARVPPSPFRASDGSLTPRAEAGKLLFENQAGCAACHTGPLFIPAPPAPATIPGGVGTGLAPANVPSLLGLWNTGSYLHDGSAETVLDVLLQNPGDQHGSTSTLTAEQRNDLVTYLLSL